MTISSAVYAPVPKFSLLDSNLEQINAALHGAYFSTGSKMISIQGDTFPFQDVINRVYQLMPSKNAWSDSLSTYVSVATKIRSAITAANEEEPPGYCLELLAIFKRAFSCCGCTDACREEQILSDSYLIEVEWLGMAPPEALGDIPLI